MSCPFHKHTDPLPASAWSNEHAHVVFSALLQSSLDAIVAIDDAGAVVEFNPAAERIFGYERGDAIGRPIHELIIPPSLRDAHLAGMDKLRETGEGPVLRTRVEVPAMRSDGSEFPVELEITPVDLDGRAVFIAAIREISEQRQREQRRRDLTEIQAETREILQMLLLNTDLSACMQSILDRIGSRLGASWAFVDRRRDGQCATEPSHTWPESEPVCSNDAQRYASLAQWCVQQLRSDQPLVLAGDQVSHVPEDARGLITEHRVGSMLVLPLNVSGRTEMFMAFACEAVDREWPAEIVAVLHSMAQSLGRAIERTIAERHRVELLNRLQEALDRAESSNQFKSRFLASMSHEMRTPMTSILGYATLMERGDQGFENYSEWAGTVRRNADHLLSLLNDVLDLSKIEAGQLVLGRSEISRADLLRSCEDLFRPLAKEKGLELRVEVAPDAPALFVSDETRIRQVLFNIVSNAVRYTDSGIVTIRCQRVLGDDLRSHIRFVVNDTGVGISPDRLERLFEPWSQAEDSSRRVGGTGLGLDIANRLVEALGGSISVESTPGRGSSFALLFPCEEFSEGEGQGRFAEPTLGSGSKQEFDFTGRRALLTDDFDDNRALVALFLEQRGVVVTEACDGPSAIEAFENPANQFDFVLLDIQMPGMDGYEAAERMRTLDQAIPIIALTAHAMASDRERCMQAGCDGYVSKPVVLDELFGVIGRLLTAPRATEPAPEPPACERFQIVGNPKFASLIEDYADRMSDLAGDFERALSDERADDILRLAHKVKGTAANFGFPRIGEVARLCEHQLRAGEGLSSCRKDVLRLIRLLHTRGELEEASDR